MGSYSIIIYANEYGQPKGQDLADGDPVSILPNSLKPPGCPALILLITGKGFSPFKCLFLITVGNTF
jgi:hypothetical protein